MNIINNLKAVAVASCFLACAIAFQSLKRTDDIWFDAGMGERK